MIVKCITTYVKDVLNAKNSEDLNQSIKCEEVSLTKDEEYHVYGILFLPNTVWYMLESNQSGYLWSYCADFFEKHDLIIPNNWCLIQCHENFDHPVLVPRGILQVPYFFEKLIDGDETAKSIFKQLRMEYS